jgi:hypothetical protein
MVHVLSIINGRKVGFRFCQEQMKPDQHSVFLTLLSRQTERSFAQAPGHLAGDPASSGKNRGPFHPRGRSRRCRRAVFERCCAWTEGTAPSFVSMSTAFRRVYQSVVVLDEEYDVWLHFGKTNPNLVRGSKRFVFAQRWYHLFPEQPDRAHHIIGWQVGEIEFAEEHVEQAGLRRRAELPRNRLG